MTTNNMGRFRAAAIHLALSIAIAIVAFLAVRWVWYPGPLYEHAGGRGLFLLVVAVHVVAGPLLTLVVFKPGKRGLAFDLVFIGMLQLGALAYGMWTLSVARPVYVVFVKDRFELTRATDIEPAELERVRGTPWARLPWLGPTYIGVAFPADPQERFNLALSGIAGRDIHTFPRYYVPYERVAAQAAAAGRPLAGLRAFNPGQESRIEALASAYHRAPADLVFLPLKADKADFTVILGARDGAVLGLETLRPWEFR